MTERVNRQTGEPGWADLYELSRPFPKQFIERKDGQDFVAHHVIVQRLLSVVGPYDFELVEVIRGDVAARPPDPTAKSRRGKEGTPELHNVVVGGIWRLSCWIDGRQVRVEEVGDVGDVWNWPHDGARLKDAASDCIATGTLIPTQRGLLPVEQVRPGDQTLTRGGWRPVTHHWLAGEQAPVYQALLSDGTVLTGTANHPVYVRGHGFMYLAELQRGAILFTWADLHEHPLRKWYSGAFATAAMQAAATSPAGTAPSRSPSTGPSMRLTTARSLPDGMSITATWTPATTVRRTSWRCRPTSMAGTIAEILGASTGLATIAAGPTMPVAQSGSSGARLPAEIAIADAKASMPRIGPARSAGRRFRSLSDTETEAGHAAALALSAAGTEELASAPSAGRHSWPAANGRSTAPVAVVDVRIAGKAPVWNLTVSDRNEFFANGVLTHNSIKRCCMRFGLGLSLWAQEHWFLDKQLAPPPAPKRSNPESSPPVDTNRAQRVVQSALADPQSPAWAKDGRQ